MNKELLTYLIFGIVLLAALVYDVVSLSSASKKMTIKNATKQTVFWVCLALLFGVAMWQIEGPKYALEYVSAYLMEWSLSIDNIFVFILIFNFFKIDEKDIPKALLLGILAAILLRIIFITVGVSLVEKASWILYLFGFFLVYTGIKMFVVEQDDTYDPAQSPLYKTIKKLIPITDKYVQGKFSTTIDGKKMYTPLMVVVLMLSVTDIVFALDSIPAVFAISQNKLVIFTSNIFAVLGLRSLFFMLQGAVSKFDYLQQGIAIVLIFVGAKMLVEYFNIHIPTIASLMVIVVCLGGSIFYSVYNKKKDVPEDLIENE